MVRVQVVRRTDGAVQSFAASGHAGHAEYGYDIVCAAVSVLTQAAVLGLERHAGLQPAVEIDDATGFLSCRLASLPATDERFVKGQAILETMVTGLVETARSYPDSIQVKEVTEP